MSRDFVKKLNYNEGLRIALCMLPMPIAYFLGYGSVGVPIGQAAFFVSAQPLPKQGFYRLTNGILFITIGLGFYLIGGTVVFNFYSALIYTFLVSIALGLLTGWRMASILAFSFFSVYTAGLNATNPNSVPVNFLAFAFASAWATVISLPKFWPGVDLPEFKKPPLIARVETGLRMGIATTLALFIGDYFSYSKLGWAPSAAASVQRFDVKVSDQRAKLRAIGTVAGALGLVVFFILVPNSQYWVIAAFILAIVNGLTQKINKLGFLPFYTMIILILYSLNDPAASKELLVNRVLYNIVGVIIAVAVVHYSFPRLFNYIRTRPVFREEIEKLNDKL